MKNIIKMLHGNVSVEAIRKVVQVGDARAIYPLQRILADQRKKVLHEACKEAIKTLSRRLEG